MVTPHIEETANDEDVDSVDEEIADVLLDEQEDSGVNNQKKGKT